MLYQYFSVNAQLVDPCTAVDRQLLLARVKRFA